MYILCCPYYLPITYPQFHPQHLSRLSGYARCASCASCVPGDAIPPGAGSIQARDDEEDDGQGPNEPRKTMGISARVRSPSWIIGQILGCSLLVA